MNVEDDIEIDKHYYYNNAVSVASIYHSINGGPGLTLKAAIKVWTEWETKLRR